jgi:hypothetical protein
VKVGSFYSSHGLAREPQGKDEGSARENLRVRGQEGAKFESFPPRGGVFHKICGKAVDIVSVRVEKAEI